MLFVIPEYLFHKVNKMCHVFTGSW